MKTLGPQTLRTIAFIGFLSLSTLGLQAQPKEKSLNFDLKIQNLFFWRGLVPSHTPLLIAELFYNLKGDMLKAGFWGGYSFDGKYRAVSCNVRYAKSGLYMEVFDNPIQSDFLDAHTTHLVDVTVAYTLQKAHFPLKMSWSTIVLGRDTCLDETGDKKNRYSTYAELSMPVWRSRGQSVSLGAGGAFSFAGKANFYADHASLTNLYVAYQRPLEVLNYGIPVSLTARWSPGNHYGVVELAFALL